MASSKDVHSDPAADRAAIDLGAVRASPNVLSRHYTRFKVAQRILLTGHSHQAWPDCALDGLIQCFADAAEHVDDKWGRAFEMADRVRRGFARLLESAADARSPQSPGAPSGDIALGANTHELVVRFISALPLDRRPRLVTTDGEFHTLRRQLDRLGEAGLEIERVDAHPVETLSARLAEATNDRTAAVFVSCVLFRNARIVHGLNLVLERCQQVGAELLVDAYHQLNVVPFSLAEQGLEAAYVVGGGYKYLQLGEGNCFLRVPAGCTLRPVVTGWFSEFSVLSRSARSGHVQYGEGPDRFAGATYDPSSHYRAARVLEFFDRHRLDAMLLREISQHQVSLLATRFDDLDLDPSLITRERDVPLSEIGGFLALHTPHAAQFSAGLQSAGISTDYRGSSLRLGPAPYLSDAQLELAIEALAEVSRTLKGDIRQRGHS
ncbi:MAG: kynureninase [Gammaproteobacteria bacterium]